MTPHTGCAITRLQSEYVFFNRSRRCCCFFCFIFLSRSSPELPQHASLKYTHTHTQTSMVVEGGGGMQGFQFIRQYLIWKHLCVLGDVSSPRGDESWSRSGRPERDSSICPPRSHKTGETAKTCTNREEVIYVVAWQLQVVVFTSQICEIRNILH